MEKSKKFNFSKIDSTAKRLTELCLFVIVTGLFTMESFHILSNIGILVITGIALCYLLFSYRSLRIFMIERQFSSFFLYFLVILISLYFTTENNAKNARQLFELRYLFLTLPFSFALLPPFPRETYRNVFTYFFIIVLITAAGSTLIYLRNKEYFDFAYGRSGVIPTPIHHIRYSLMVCFATFMGFYSLKVNYFKSTALKILIGIASVFLVVYIHVLAVRISLVIFYLGIALMLLILMRKNIKKGIIGLALGLAILYAGFGVFDTLTAKIGYTLYDIKLGSSAESANYYSVSRRFIVYQVAYNVFLDNFLFGTGDANLLEAMRAEYKRSFPVVMEENYMAPHNEFLRILAGMGIIGFIAFLVSFYYPLFRSENYIYAPLAAIYFIATISFFTEDTLETKLGLTFCLFFICFCLHANKSASIIRENISTI